MVKQTVNTGTVANDGTGDFVRNAFIKVNDNFTELYDTLGGATITVTDGEILVGGPGNTIVGDSNFTWDDVSSLLTLTGTLPELRFADTDVTGFHSIFSNGALLQIAADNGGTDTGSGIQFTVDNTEMARIDSNGRLGVNEPTPLDLIHVTDTVNAGIRFEDSDLSGAHARFGVTPTGAGVRIEADPDNSEASSTIQFYVDGTEWGRISDTGELRMPTTTVASLTAAGTVGVGARHFVTDANATTFASIVAGGGANGVPVYSDGTNWRIG